MGRGRGANQLNLNSKEVLFKGRLVGGLKEFAINWPEEVRAAIKNGLSPFQVSQAIMGLSEQDFDSLNKLNHIDLINDKLFRTYQEKIESSLQISYKAFYENAENNSFVWNYHYSLAFQRLLFQIKNGNTSPTQVHPLRSLILNTKTNYKGEGSSQRMLLSENEIKSVVHVLYHNHQDILDDLLSEASLQSFYQDPNSRALAIFTDNGEDKTKEISGLATLNKDNASFLIKHTCEQIIKDEQQAQAVLDFNFNTLFPISEADSNQERHKKYKRMRRSHFPKLKDKLLENPYSELENLVVTQTPVGGMVDAFRINYRNLLREKHQQVFIATLLNKSITTVRTDSKREELLKDKAVVSEINKVLKQLDDSGEILGTVDLHNYSRQAINEFLKKAANLYFVAGIKVRRKYVRDLRKELDKLN